MHENPRPKEQGIEAHGEVKHPSLQSLIDDGNDLHTVRRLIQFLQLFRGSLGDMPASHDDTRGCSLDHYSIAVFGLGFKNPPLHWIISYLFLYIYI